MLQYKLIKQQKVKQLKLSTSAMHIQEPEQLGVTIERLLNVFTVYLWNLFHWEIEYIVFL